MSGEAQSCLGAAGKLLGTAFSLFLVYMFVQAGRGVYFDERAKSETAAAGP